MGSGSVLPRNEDIMVMLTSGMVHATVKKCAFELPYFFLEKTRKVYWTIHTDSAPEKIGCCHEVLGQRPNQVEVDFNIIREEVD